MSTVCPNASLVYQAADFLQAEDIINHVLPLWPGNLCHGEFSHLAGAIAAALYEARTRAREKE